MGGRYTGSRRVVSLHDSQSYYVTGRSLSIPPVTPDHGGAQVVTVNDFIERAKWARKQRESELRVNQWTFGEIGAEMGQLLGTEALQGGTVGRWFRDAIPDSLSRIVALARVLHVDPGWLTFGEECGVPAPPGFTPRAAAETPAQTARRQLPTARRAMERKPHRKSG